LNKTIEYFRQELLRNRLEETFSESQIYNKDLFTTNNEVEENKQETQSNFEQHNEDL
jgi:hypothetical protein